MRLRRLAHSEAALAHEPDGLGPVVDPMTGAKRGALQLSTLPAGVS